MAQFIKRINLLFGLSAFLLGLVSVISLIAEIDSSSANAWVEHTHTVIEDILSLRNTVSDAAIARRDYLSTGKPKEMAAYKLSIDRETRYLESLIYLTRDNPDQQHRLDQLKPITGQLTAIQRKGTLAPDPSLSMSSTQSSFTNQTRPLVRSLALVLNGMLVEERLLLADRSARASTEARTEMVTVVAGTILALTLMLLAAMTSRRDATLRRRVLDDLEERVRERTSDLAIANEYLHYEIAQRQEAEERLGRLASIVESSEDAIIGKTLDGTITTWNGGAARLYGYTAAEIIGQPIARIIPENRRSEFGEIMAKIRLGISVEHMETIRMAKDGRCIDVSVTVSPLRDENGKLIGASSIARDISDRVKAERMIEWQSFHDSLTHLPNRTLFQDRLDQALASAERKDEQVAVMFMDLDRFKNINDSLGHATGDLVLTEVGRRLNGQLRHEETLARMGGDEFGVLLPAIEGPQVAAKTADDLLDLLAAPMTIGGREFFIGGSIGISIFPFDGSDGETLLRNADLAMYRAKERGGGRYQLYTEKMNLAAVERLSLESRLRKAIELNEFLMLYQPLVRIQDQAICGVEALVRWRHAELGITTPDKFIPLAEETGLIVQLGDLVLREVCRQAAAWKVTGSPLKIAVNLSPRQLSERDVAQKIEEIIKTSGIDRTSLEIELTETALVANADTAVAVLHDLRAMGLQISVDDFGTGYSSLSYLERLPLDILKIDRSFLADVHRDGKAWAVVRAVIELGHALGLKVVAEGVETEFQHQVLRDLGCDLAQGFFYCKPAHPDEIAQMISHPVHG
jgi:diguanylate cyclase (GGDEF)-like protein/PAS domain S-box-containing protein